MERHHIPLVNSEQRLLDQDDGVRALSTKTYLVDTNDKECNTVTTTLTPVYAFYRHYYPPAPQQGLLRTAPHRAAVVVTVMLTQGSEQDQSGGTPAGTRVWCGVMWYGMQ